MGKMVESRMLCVQCQCPFTSTLLILQCFLPHTSFVIVIGQVRQVSIQRRYRGVELLNGFREHAMQRTAFACQ